MVFWFQLKESRQEIVFPDFRCNCDCLITNVAVFSLFKSECQDFHGSACGCAGTKNKNSYRRFMDYEHTLHVS